MGGKVDKIVTRLTNKKNVRALVRIVDEAVGRGVNKRFVGGPIGGFVGWLVRVFVCLVVGEFE